jgi:uncharacterized membrane protein
MKGCIKMAKIEASVVINRPIDVVFVYVTDVRSWPLWEDGLEKVKKTSKGPMGVGTTFRGANQAMGRRMEWTSVVTEYKPSRKWGQNIRSKSWSTEESLIFEPVEGGTRITLISKLELSIFFRLMTRIVVRTMQKKIEGNLTNLKNILEAQA